MSVRAEGHLAFAKAWSFHLPGSELEGVEEFGEGDMHRNGHLFLKLKF